MRMVIVECTREYWEFVRKLRMDGRVIDGFLETTPITEEQQIKYMISNSEHYRIALFGGKPAGYVGVINDDIRVCTHPDFFGMGVGKFMIKSAMAIWPTAYAKVKLGNIASEKLFLSCGFEVSGRDENFTYYKLKNKMVSLKSSITAKGKYVSKILHFVGGEKRTFNGVDTDSIKQGQFTKFETKDGRLVMINDKNILCIEIIKED
jgi:RimJ/RimL family protein N-acetyltransferase